jgi:dimeric dUTPase (all-alpha-NTP-PPase superfamily)
MQLAAQLAAMAELQSALNDNVHAAWRSQGHEYYRAVWVECAELLDHYGWKWWKHQRTDLAQVKLEIVDIWHFGLSDLIRDGRIDAVRIDPAIVAAFERPAPAADFRACIETLAGATLTERRFPIEAFVDVLYGLPMSFAELYQIYVGKNVLNHFRQAHGYQVGRYMKTWHGREDNEHLFEIVSALDHASATFSSDLYAALEARYVASTRS